MTIEIDVTAEKKLLNEFLGFIRGQRLLLIEGTRSVENLLYKEQAPDSERGIISIAAELNRLECNFEIVESNSPDLDVAIARANLVLIYAHGEFGEDGRLQGLLDYKNKPYPGSGVLASAICLDKVVFKSLMISAGLSTPAYTLPSEQSDLSNRIGILGYPVMAKPRCGGSSIGICRLSDETELQAWRVAINPSELDDYFFENHINGRFLTIGIIELVSGLKVMPILEVDAGIRFYDAQIKLGNEKGEVKPRVEVPANLPLHVAENVRTLAKRAFLQSRCEGIGRVDIMLDEVGCPHLLEINTIPGMSINSNMTHAFASLGFDYAELLLAVLRTAYLKQDRKSFADKEEVVGNTHEVRIAESV